MKTTNDTRSHVNQVFVNSTREVFVKRKATNNDTPLPQAVWPAVWLRTALHVTTAHQLVVGIFGLHLLCWAAVSPWDPYPATQGAGKAVHSSTHSPP